MSPSTTPEDGREGVERDGDERWLALFDTHAEGDFLTPQEHDFLHTYQACSPEVRAEQAVWRELQGLAQRQSQGLLADDRLIANVMNAFAAQPRPDGLENPIGSPGAVQLSVIEGAKQPPSRLLWAGSGAGLTAAAAALLVWLTPVATPTPAPSPAPLAATVPVEVPVQPVANEVVPKVSEASALAFVMVSGSAEQSGQLVRANGQKARAGAELQVRDELCVAAQSGGKVCLTKGTKARVLARDVELLVGKAHFDGFTLEGAADRPTTETQAFGVVVAGVRFAAPQGVYEVVTRSEQSDAVDIDVQTGSVKVDDRQGTLIASLGAGDHLRLKGRRGAALAAGAEPSPSEISPGKEDKAVPASNDAKEWVTRARAWVSEGRYAQAAAAYEKAIRADKASALSRASMVSLGQLYGERLKKPELALRAYDAYLSSGGGSLAEEAHWGKIEALRVLGREAAEREAMSDFLRAFPSSSYADKIRARLK